MSKKNIKYGLLSLIFILSGCAKSDSSRISLDSNEDTYKIAVIAPQIGPYKSLGNSIIHGAELAVINKNATGGINGKKIELIKVDDGGLSGEGTWRARNLVEQMVLGVIGHLNSDISIPASEVYSKAMIAEITPGSTNPFFTERERVRGYVFRTIGRDDDQGKLAGRFAIQKGFKKLAILYNNRSYGSSLASEFVKEVEKEKSSSQIVFYKSYKVDTKNFKEEVSQLKTNSPDFLFFVGEYGDASKFLKEYKLSGLKTTFLGSEGVFDEDFIEDTKGVSEGALVISLPEVNDESFIKTYKDKFGKNIGSYSANSYDATNILISAIQKVKQKNSEKIAKAIKEIKDFPGLTGSLSFDEKGDLIEPKFTIYKVKGSKFVSLESEEKISQK